MMNYSKRLTLLHGICVADTYADGANTNLDEYQVADSAHFLASFLAFRLHKTTHMAFVILSKVTYYCNPDAIFLISPFASSISSQ